MTQVAMYARTSTKVSEIITTGKEVRGVTVLNDEIFLVYEKSAKVEVFEAATLERKRNLAVAGLTKARDLKSNVADGCLYIADDEGPEGLPCVHRVDVAAHDGEEESSSSTRWPLDEIPGGISLTPDGRRVIVTCYGALTPTLKEYTTDGELVRKINLPAEMVHPRDAFQLPTGNFVVSHGFVTFDHVCRVCLIANDGGSVVQSYGSTPGSAAGHLKDPVRIAAGGANGFILVADRENNRILVLDETLSVASCLVDLAPLCEDGEDSLPHRLCLDQQRARLLVAESEWRMAGHPKMWAFDVKFVSLAA